jgi:metal-sulfur cluster biosynthetic enzyme
MGCPVGPMLIEQAEVVLTSLFPEEIEKTTVEIVWDPPWSPDKMKPEVRELMQGF